LLAASTLSVLSFSAPVFPTPCPDRCPLSLRSRADSQRDASLKMRLRSVSIVFSLPLQRLLHFNSYYSVFYAAAEIGLTVFKLTSTVLDEKMKYSLPVLVAIFVLSELARLPLGYTGNLREKVSELSAFWLLSLFPQLPLVAYLTIGQIYTGGFLPLDLAAGICLLAMLVSAATHGFRMQV
jgi:Predicted membrane protein